MIKRFNFDTKNANLSGGLLLFGFLLMFVPLIVDHKYKEFLIWLIITCFFLFLLWFCLVRGTYVFIDQITGNLYSSRFFIKKIIPLSKVTALIARGTFGGMVTELRIEYIDEKGKLKNSIIMARQAFRKVEFQEFLATLRFLNSEMSIPSSLSSK